jgi:hypothetical protein
MVPPRLVEIVFKPIALLFLKIKVDGKKIIIASEKAINKEAVFHGLRNNIQSKFIKIPETIKRGWINDITPKIAEEIAR